MAVSQKLVYELEEVVSGNPWLGMSVMDVLWDIDAAVIHNRHGNAHTIAEILLHMVAWTEEIASRLKGNKGKEPDRGDWPASDNADLNTLIALFVHEHAALKDTALGRSDEDWEKKNNTSEGHPLTLRVHFEGLIQHHIYHLGQIALLNRQFADV